VAVRRERVADFILPAGPEKGRKLGLNENYAREIMELHILGENGGYTQQDVIEVARCFTGWTIDRPQQGGGFLYRPLPHDQGQKRVLGHVIPPGGSSSASKTASGGRAMRPRYAGVPSSVPAHTGVRAAHANAASTCMASPYPRERIIVDLESCDISGFQAPDRSPGRPAPSRPWRFRASALAALRLMNRLSFLGCSFGRSAGVVPHKRRSMYPPNA
jgi:hypothetical protein